jgi:hypothetical protein
MHHPALATRDWCQSAGDPRLVAWGIAVVYTTTPQPPVQVRKTKGGSYRHLPAFLRIV